MPTPAEARVAAAALVTIPNVEIARAGTWNASTGPWNCTPEDIADAVRAAADPSFRTPIIKLGHVDPRFDGQPAVGRIENLRASEDGQVLLGDLVGVPAALAEVIPVAYNSRSVEAALNVTVEGGKTYRMVVEGVALLGAALPAIQNLNDLLKLYDVPTDLDQYVAASHVAARMEGGSDVAQILVRASATIDQLLAAVRGWITTKGLSDYAWVREVYTDKVIIDDDQGRLWAVTWSETGGDFTFGDPQAVMVEYVPVANTVAAAAAHKLHLPLLYERGQVTAAAADSSGQPHERTNVPDLTDREKRIREALGLGEDATEEQVQDAVLSKLTAPPQEQTSQTPAGQAPAGSTTTPDQTQQPVNQTGQAQQGQQQQGQNGTGQVQASGEDPRLAEVTRLSQELAQLRRERYEESRDRVVAGALADGKIRPADRDAWVKRYDKDAELTTDILASMAPGTAVPVAAKGHAGETENPEDVEMWNQVSAMFGIKPGSGA